MTNTGTPQRAARRGPISKVRRKRKARLTQRRRLRRCRVRSAVGPHRPVYGGATGPSATGDRRVCLYDYTSCANVYSRKELARSYRLTIALVLVVVGRYRPSSDRTETSGNYDGMGGTGDELCLLPNYILLKLISSARMSINRFIPSAAVCQKSDTVAADRPSVMNAVECRCVALVSLLS
ncbi:hypothetical protein EVAR_88087_1 [Eumeta japonica]|uniref:Uncharacterized protein n=1 Tax=Eumeta variegata TaxID=151549 RepID=A0A4C1WGG3_EUMVA|nr:hypothetical protein EVAR_88087_1 [Eumeta japonica]